MKNCIDKAAIGNILHKLWKKDTGFENIDIAQIAYNRALQDVQCEIDTLEVQEEPVSEDFGEYINELSKQFPEVSFAKLSRIAVRVAKWQKEQIKKAMDLGEPPYLISIEQAYYRTLKLLEE